MQPYQFRQSSIKVIVNRVCSFKSFANWYSARRSQWRCFDMSYDGDDVGPQTGEDGWEGWIWGSCEEYCIKHTHEIQYILGSAQPLQCCSLIKIKIWESYQGHYRAVSLHFKELSWLKNLLNHLFNQVQLSMISLSMIVVCGQARVDERDGSGEIARYSAWWWWYIYYDEV